jgi:hypothetical protein
MTGGAEEGVRQEIASAYRKAKEVVVADPVRVRAHAARTCLCASVGIAALMVAAWGGWGIALAIFLSPAYVLLSYAFGRWIGHDAVVAEMTRGVLADRAGVVAKDARDAAKHAESSARDAQNAAQDAKKAACDRAVAGEAATRAAVSAEGARRAAGRAGQLAEQATRAATEAAEALSARKPAFEDARIRQAAQAAMEAAQGATEAAEEASEHDIEARRALDEARTVVATEAESRATLLKGVAKVNEFLRFMDSPHIEASRTDAIRQNIAKEIVQLVIATHDPGLRRLVERDKGIHNELRAMHAGIVRHGLDAGHALDLLAIANIAVP